MVPRGLFHIPSRLLLNSFFKLLTPGFSKDNKKHKFKKSLKAHLSAKDIQLGPSCRINLYQYLLSLNLPKKSEVLIAPITIPDIINAILLSDLRPVFVDMNTTNHSIDIHDLNKKIGKESRVIISTLLSGLDSDRSVLNEICKKNDLIFIEDISQVPFKNYFMLKDSAPVAIQSLSIGKTISTLVGGAISFKESNSFELVNLDSPPKKSYFIRQMLENAKVDFFTSSCIYNFLTRHILAIIAKYKPNIYFNIHQTNTITKYNERDIFFDDIPTRRHSFPKDLYFYFNNWMAELGLEMLNVWEDSHQKRIKNKKIFLMKADQCLIENVASAFFLESNFPVRVPIYVNHPKDFQLYCISRGLDCGNYGLNLCNEEPVFSEFYIHLKNSAFIKNNCFFLNLNETLSERKLVQSIQILNAYFREQSCHNKIA